MNSISTLAEENQLFIEPRSTPHDLLAAVEQFITTNDIQKNEYYLDGVNYAFKKQRWYFDYSNKEEFKNNRDFVILISDINHNNIELSAY